MRHHSLEPSHRPQRSPQACTPLGFTTLPLDKTPYTKCQLRQQTNQTLAFLKETSYGGICSLIITFSHTAEHMAIVADIANSQARKLCKTLREIT